MKADGFAGWAQLKAGGVERVAQAKEFAPFGWYVLVTEKRDAFYKITTQIFRQTAVILLVSLAIALILLFYFSFIMTQPLRMVVSVMRQIMSTSDLSKRVEILYKDETGELGHSLNLMTEELEKAYKQIKGYALKAVVAQHREQKIRNIFQKYVPKAVIDEFFANPESMLVGQDRVLAVLFSDIRGFTTLSEGLPPNEVVESLNAYFGRMVKIIMEHKGIVDKYIGDAIMATFGAPVHYGDEAYQAVSLGLRHAGCAQALQRRPAQEGPAAIQDRDRHQLWGSHGGKHRLGTEDGLHGDRGHGEPGLPAGRAHEGLPRRDDRVRAAGE